MHQANGRAGTDGPTVHCAIVGPHRRMTVFSLIWYLKKNQSSVFCITHASANPVKQYETMDLFSFKDHGFNRSRGATVRLTILSEMLQKLCWIKFIVFWFILMRIRSLFRVLFWTSMRHDHIQIEIEIERVQVQGTLGTNYRPLEHLEMILAQKGWTNGFKWRMRRGGDDGRIHDVAGRSTKQAATLTFNPWNRGYTMLRCYMIIIIESFFWPRCSVLLQ